MRELLEVIRQYAIVIDLGADSPNRRMYRLKSRTGLQRLKELNATADRVAHNLTLDVNATRTDTNCAFDTRDGVLTLSGNPNVTYAAHLNIVNAALSGLQTASHKGGFTWSLTGGSGTCDVDITRTFDPSTKTLTIKGSFCGHAVDVTKTKNG